MFELQKISLNENWLKKTNIDWYSPPRTMCTVVPNILPLWLLLVPILGRMLQIRSKL